MSAFLCVLCMEDTPIKNDTYVANTNFYPHKRRLFMVTKSKFTIIGIFLALGIFLSGCNNMTMPALGEGEFEELIPEADRVSEPFEVILVYLPVI
jgi:hypothetical protein